MRKSAILMVLTLALTSVSTAALIDEIQLQWSPGDSVVKVLGLDGDYWVGGIYVSDAYKSQAAIVQEFDISHPSNADIMLYDGGVLFTIYGPINGFWFDFGIDTELTQVGFDIYNENDTHVGTIIVPEPVTLFLFGLGGLFVRKRIG